MREARFRGLVTRALGQLPDRIFVGVENVAVLVRSAPSSNQRSTVRRASTLLGLYEGVPQIVREDKPIYPDRITLFQWAIEAEAQDTGQSVLAVIHATLVHEIGHHLGLTDRDLRHLERRKWLHPPGDTRRV